jgi:hypothetical protein
VTTVPNGIIAVGFRVLIDAEYDDWEGVEERGIFHNIGSIVKFDNNGNMAPFAVKNTGLKIKDVA